MPVDHAQNRDRYIADLLNPDKGYVLIRKYFSDEEIDRYRNECENFLETGPVCVSRINTDWIPDYVHPRSHDKVGRTYRIYQYFHNDHSEPTTAFFDKALSIRNTIEQTWLDDPRYRLEKETLQNYIIVTKYITDTGHLPPHRDYYGPAPFPLLQSLVLLSRMPDDYTGGDFRLRTKNGTSLSLANDIGATKGDLLVFDKSLEHTVELTQAGTSTNLGRWSVLVGARAIKDNRVRGVSKRLLYSYPFYPYTRPLAKALRLLGVPI
jgi:hypothetical protein